jgi:hypothetical protein
MVDATRCGTFRARIGLAGRLRALLLMSFLVAVGFGAVMAAANGALLAIKVLGAVYLVWLGIHAIRRAGKEPAVVRPAGDRNHMNFTGRCPSSSGRTATGKDRSRCDNRALPWWRWKRCGCPSGDTC